MKKTLKLLWGFIPLVLTVVVYKAAFCFPDFTENVYSRTIYPCLTYLAYCNSFLPFSLSEILLYLFAAFLVFYLGFIIHAFFTKEKLTNFIRRIICFFIIISSVVSIYISGWGLNYARNTLADTMGIETGEYTVSELVSVCEKLAEEANENRKNVSTDENGVYKLSRPKNEILSDVKNLYKNYAPYYLNYGAETDVKNVMWGESLSSTETMGIFSPFTYECHINSDMPDLYYASSAVHEYAHFKGFAREDECNFIAWFISRQSDDADFKYSGSILALIYAVNALYEESPEEFYKIYEKIDDGIKLDWKNDAEYWDNYETEFAEETEQIYNDYLVTNGVSDGSKSYGRMLDLIIAIDKKGLL